ncbi:MAG: hypothetical protein M3022_19770 [Actinomycetota bacterium]|nr:hypothetical protein [Actinomycetota bacterium]
MAAVARGDQPLLSALSGPPGAAGPALRTFASFFRTPSFATSPGPDRAR